MIRVLVGDRNETRVNDALLALKTVASLKDRGACEFITPEYVLPDCLWGAADSAFNPAERFDGLFNCTN